MIKQKCLIIMLLLSVFFIKEVYSEGFEVNESKPTAFIETKEPVSLELISSHPTIQGDTPFTVALRIRHEAGWHSYWKNPGDAGIATEIKWNLPEGFTHKELPWPTPHKFEEYGILGYGYEGEIFILSTIEPPKNFSSDKPVSIEASVTWTACSDSNCLPGEKVVKLTLNDPKNQNSHRDLVNKAMDSIPELASVKGSYKDEHWLQLELTNLGHLPEKEHEIAFYPLTEKAVDGSAKALLIPKKNAGEFSLLIKRHEECETSASLEGIALLPEIEGSSKSLQIHAKLDKPAKALISFLDKRQAAKKSQEMEGNEAFAFEGGFFLYLLMAFVGGLILNLMPCVLPVVSFKILSFVKLAGEDRSLTAKHGLAFSLGVLVSFWILASALLIIQAYGKAVGWGFQLQEPIFVATLIIVIFIFSLSLFGVFEAGTLVSSWAGSNAQKVKSNQKLLGSFFSGVLATAVATPCTGPFLGPAVGFAVQEPPIFAIMIFTSLGLGMALPYLLLSFFPSLLRFLPKPGAWMVSFKEGTGFIMMATVIWLLWVFTAETSSNALILLLFSLFVISFACWIFGKWGTPVKSKRTRLISLGLFALLLVGSFKIATLASSLVEAPAGTNKEIAGRWEPFSKSKINDLVAEGKPVFVDFTARWCLICQANHFVLGQPSVDEAFKKQGVTLMKADWTRHDPEITEELAKYGRNGVPLYLFYSGKRGAQPIILPQVLTPEIVLEYVETYSPIAEN